MSHLHHFNFNIQTIPPQPGTQVLLGMNQNPLLQNGFNLSMEVSTATAFRGGANVQPMKSITLMAHFDTGASNTCIDDSIATHLGLVPVGQVMNHTAAGPRQCNTYSVDVAFPGTGLRPRQNLRISSVQLNFNLAQALANPNDPKNFGILIGRDIMASWHITWYGPSSSVLISD